MSFPDVQEDADRPTESTYYKHEMEQVSHGPVDCQSGRAGSLTPCRLVVCWLWLPQVNQLFKQTLIGMGMVSFIHFKMGMKPVLVRARHTHLSLAVWDA